MVPKAELHVHLEGTAPPDARAPASPSATASSVPDGVFAAPDRFAWRDFLDFLRAYDQAASVIRTGEDYRDITYEYLAACAARGRDLRRAHRLARPRARRRPAATRSMRRHRRRGSTTPARDRHRGAHPQRRGPQLRRRARRGGRRAHRRAPAPLRRRLLPGRRRGRLPARAVRASAYEIARDAGPGLHRPRGRVGGPGDGARAIELPVTRVGHGVRAIEDPALVAELAERGDRARGLPDVQRRARRVPDLRGAPASRRCARRASG